MHDRCSVPHHEAQGSIQFSSIMIDHAQHVMRTGAPPAAAGLATATSASPTPLDPALLLQRLAQPTGSTGTNQQAQLATTVPAPNSSEVSAAATSTTQAAPAVVTAPAEEPLEDAEARLEDGSLKQAIFAALKLAGPTGLTVAHIMDHLKAQGFDWGSNPRAAKSSISSTCGHDNVFLRLGPGRFTLRALPGALEHVDAAAGCSRQELEVCLPHHSVSRLA